MYRKTEIAIVKAEEKEMFENKKEVLPLNKAALLLKKLRSKIWQVHQVRQ